MPDRKRNEIDLGYARLDLEREERCGFPEFIFGEGKTKEQNLGIMKALAEKGGPVLATRLSAEAERYLAENLPGVEIDSLAHTAAIRSGIVKKKGSVAVVCAGTSDLGVAGEARNTLEICGYSAELFPDAGVAGLHRLLSVLPEIAEKDAAIAIAGMEGALPSVLAGLVSIPVIAVPTHIGCGASFGGVAALLAMLNSCASGVTVVNIDNGFGAACAAVRILNGFKEKNKK